MSSLLLQLLSSWPYIVAAIALAYLVIHSGVLKSFTKKEHAPPRLAIAPPAGAAEPGPEPAPAPSNEAATGGESAAASFARTMRFLKDNAADGDYRYSTPWYLVIGDPGAGKSTMLANAGVNLLEEESPSTWRQELEWRFLPGGILLCVDGGYFGPRNGQPRDVRGWGRLLRLLQNNRPRRPVDGIVLSISAADLTGPAALDELHLGARAARYAELLSQAQRTLGFSLPVYVVVSKCDGIGGFRSFCRELPVRSEQDIFGWSNPYNLETTFSVKWVDEAFDSLAQDLQRLQSEIFVERTDMPRPDDVFLFPDEIAALREPLRVYLDRLFHQTAYRESFRFRGVFFCGDVTEQPPESRQVELPVEHAQDHWPEQAWEEIPQRSALVPLRGESKGVVTPIFLRSLFEKKIFAESGIAVPLSRVSVSRNRNVLAIQVVAAALALILALGTWFSYRRLSSDRGRVMPMLQAMQRMPRTPERERHNLLLAMAPAGNVSFWSLFMPTSWFSSTDQDITRAMTYACDQWVLTNLRTSLEQRTRRILDRDLVSGEQSGSAQRVTASDANADTETVAVTNVESLPEYQRLEKFVNDLTVLGENADIYDNLRQRGRFEEVDRIRKLVHYLFNSSLGELRADGHFAKAISEANGPPFTPSQEDRHRASELAKQMIGQLFDAWFGNSLLLADVDDVKKKATDLEQGRTVSYDELKELLAALKQMELDFSSPSFRWIASPKLDMNGSFRRVMLAPIQSPQNHILDPDILDFANHLGEDHLRQLKGILAEENTGLTGPLLDVKDTSVTPSPGTRDLRLAMENALNLRFMAQAGTRPIRVTLDPTMRLMWRIQPLQEVLRLTEIYQRFVDEGLRDFQTSRLRAALSRVALEQLRRNTNDLIAQSQEFQARPLTKERMAEEDETLAEVTSFRDAEEPLVQISAKFKLLGVTDLSNSLRTVMGLQAWNLLAILDQRLNDEDPYTSRDKNFGWWKGKGSLAFQSYEVRNAPELADYLTKQRERIKFLEQQADPLVQFLNATFPTRGEAQNRLISRWQKIIADFRQYDGKKPGASLSALEDFVITEMDKITPENACQATGVANEAREQNLDYFMQIRSDLRQAIIDRCLTLNAEGAFQTYTEIAELFNRKLAGNFPFASLAAANQPEANPEDILAFYQLLDRNEKAARASLKENTRFGQSSGLALAFLDQMDSLRMLVGSGSPEAEKEPPFTLEFTPHFRANQPRESGANQIIDWTLQVGGQLFHQREPDHPGRWRVGNPVRLAMRWANDSIYVPQAEAGQPNLHIRGRNAVYEFTNRWALLSLLRRQEAPVSETGSSADTKPYLLKLRIRTAMDAKWARNDTDPPPTPAIVYLQVRVTTPGGKVPLVMPAFPVKAPTLELPSSGRSRV